MQTLRRTLCLASSLALAVSLALAQTEPTLSITVQAANAKQVLAVLSKETGIAMTASPQVADEVLALRLEKVPVKQAMARIADAVDGTWKKQGDGYLLTRTYNQVTAERNREHAQLIERISKALVKQAELIGSLPTWSEEELDRTASKLASLIKRFDPTNQSPHWYEESAKLNELVPINRTLRELISKFEPEELASVSPGSQVVWSTNPTAMQRPLSDTAMELLAKLAQQQTEWHAALDRHSVANPRINGATVYLGDYGDPERPAIHAKPIAKVLLIIRNDGTYASYSVELSAYDDLGQLITTSSLNIDGEGEGHNLTVRKEEEVSGEALVQPSSALVAFNQATASYPQLRSEPSGKWMQVALHPESVDPLASWISSSVIQAAEIRHLNMVACLCDSAAYAGKIGDGKAVSVAQLFARLRYCRSNVELQDGWLTVTPSRPCFARENRVDRKVLADYLQRLAEHCDFSVEESARFALALPDTTANLLPNLMAQVIGESGQSRNTLDFLRLIGSLTNDQISRLRSGELPVSTFSDAQLEYADRIVYGRPGMLQFSPPLAAEGINVPRLNDWQLHTSGILKEPTEALPNGIPKQGFLTVTVNQEPIAMYDLQGRAFSAAKATAIDARQLAFLKFSHDHPDSFAGRTVNSPAVDTSRLIPGLQHQWRFLLRLTPNLSIAQSFEAMTFDATHVTTLDNFPEDYRKAYQNAYREYVQTYPTQKRDVPVTSGGNPPP